MNRLIERALVATAVLALAACGPSASGVANPGVDAGAADGALVDAAPMLDAAALRPDAHLPPGCVPEICGDGFDNDCDGFIDNGCVCLPGQTEPCFTGPASARQRGACHDGITTCAGGSEFASWGACVGDQVPGTEVCDAARVDENCDGTANEQCQCENSSATIVCGSDVGACRTGTQTCVGGVLGTCTGNVEPTPEVCNGIDDDCDGVIDNGLVRACGSSVGACWPGTQICQNGVWGTCDGATGATPERCNGIDDDCDGVIDNDADQPCGNNIGACVAGHQVCSGGRLGACIGAVGPKLETCNGIDDDCDGRIDNDVTRTCGTDTGACQSGTSTCVNGVFGTCVDSIAPTTEVCNGLDDNCDGRTDEGCSCTDGDTQACGTDVGACTAGTQVCSGGQWGTCQGSIGPSPETCNNVDDDCDGVVDDGLERGCGSAVGACEMGTQICSAGAWQTCEGATAPTVERCNGIDDDCDGVVDNGTDVACGGGAGACAAGVQHCVGGVLGACSGAVSPMPETCNNLDDDCDGRIDNGLSRVCGSDIGACRHGFETCAAGSWGTCAGSVGPTTEVCNGIDDNCNGQVDEGCSCVGGTTQACGSSVGACRTGTQTCTAGSWGNCMNGVGPVNEICFNGVDDNCNGQVDENCRPPVAMCPAAIATRPLATITLGGSGSDPQGGSVTYHWTVTARPSGSTSQPTSPNSASTSFFVDLAGSYTFTLTVTNSTGQTSTCTVQVTSVPPQDLHVELVWNTAYGDVDLHLTQAGVAPASAWYMSPSTGEAACWYSNTTAAWPPAGTGGDATLDIDDRDGYGPENINISTTPANGTYGIGVAYYCSHSEARNPGDPIAPGDGPTTATVKVYCGGALISTYPGIYLDKTGRFVDLARVTWPTCAGMSIMSSQWTAQVQPSYYSGPLHCSLPCSSNGNCTPGEVCDLTRGTCRLP